MPALKSKTVLGTIKRPPPHSGQKAVFGAPQRRFNWGSMGRRWRKTSGVMAFEAVPEAVERNGVVLWTAPTYGQTKIAWDECVKMCGEVARFNKTEMSAYFPGGGRIIFRSMDDPNNARGHTATLVVVDEAADVKEEAWYEVLRPTLLDTKGRAWVIGTPKGRNWFWREWMSARERDDSYAWQAPALGARVDPDTQRLLRVPHPLENTDLDFDELAQIWNTTPERSFRQEILAEFLDDGGGVFRGVTACVAGELREPYHGRFAIGADFARQHDFSVLTVMDMTSKAVVDWQRFNQIDWFSQQARIAQLYHKWKANDSQVTVLAEKNMAGDVLIEMLQRSGVPVTPFSTNYKTKRQLIEALQLAIERRLLSYPDIPQMIAELQAYEQERLQSGIIRFRAPQGMFDDCVISLALAWRVAKFGHQPKNMGSFKFLSNAPKAKKSLLQEYKQSLREKRRAG